MYRNGRRHSREGPGRQHAVRIKAILKREPVGSLPVDDGATVAGRVELTLEHHPDRRDDDQIVTVGEPPMSELTPPDQETGPAAGQIAPFPTAGSAPPAQVRFDRHELRQIMDLYGRMVAAGEWRDYAIDFLRDRAVFSVFRRAAEVPIYRIVKDPSLARKQGAYAVVASTGMILKRGHELQRVLRVIDKPVLVVV
jgi:hypothetical protein